MKSDKIPGERYEEIWINCHMSRVDPILTLYCLRERSKEHEQSGSSQRGSQGTQYQKKAKAAVDSVFSTITKALKKKDTVALVGFGTSKVGQRKARKGSIHRQGKRSKSGQRRSPSLYQGKP